MKHYKTFDEMIKLIEQFPVDDGGMSYGPKDSKWIPGNLLTKIERIKKQRLKTERVGRTNNTNNNLLYVESYC